MNRPETRTVSIGEARDELDRLASEVASRSARVLIDRGGEPVAALVSPDDLSRVEFLDRQLHRAATAMDAFSEALADVPVDELDAKIDEIVAEGRARDRHERLSV